MLMQARDADLKASHCPCQSMKGASVYRRIRGGGCSAAGGAAFKHQDVSASYSPAWIRMAKVVKLLSVFKGA